MERVAESEVGRKWCQSRQEIQNVGQGLRNDQSSSGAALHDLGRQVSGVVDLAPSPRYGGIMMYGTVCQCSWGSDPVEEWTAVMLWLYA